MTKKSLWNVYSYKAYSLIDRNVGRCEFSSVDSVISAKIEGNKILLVSGGLLDNYTENFIIKPYSLYKLNNTGDLLTMKIVGHSFYRDVFIAIVNKSPKAYMILWAAKALQLLELQKMKTIGLLNKIGIAHTPPGNMCSWSDIKFVSRLKNILKSGE